MTFVLHRKKFQLQLIIIIGLMINSCIEPFDAVTEVFEDALAIEATITNEFKKHKIKLTRAYELDDLGFNISPEKNADVRIIDESQNEYYFQEIDSGFYVSTIEFKTKENTYYELHITTQDGKNYASKPTKSPDTKPIYGLKAHRAFDRNGNEGMEILAGYDPTGDSKYYRYQYEETYKIIAPKWSDGYLRFMVSGTVVESKGSTLGLICYNTELSKSTILNSISENGNGAIPQFPVRFINRNDYIISHRYSILVKQYTISREAHLYLETLKKLSQHENIFSSSQPGFFEGNVYSSDNPNEKVLGYFDVTSVATKRIYFNYSDFFQDEPLPPYVEHCEPYYPDPAALRGVINNGSVLYYSTDGFGSHSVVSRVCGDCTLIGNSEAPEFWVD